VSETWRPVPALVAALDSAAAFTCRAAARDLRTDRVIAIPAATRAAAMAAGSTDTPSAPVIRVCARLHPRAFLWPMGPA